MPKAALSIPRLLQGVQAGRRQLQRAREERMLAVRQYIGNHAAQIGVQEPVFVNLISLYQNLFSHILVPQNPRVLISTKPRRPFTTAMQLWANDQIEKLYLEDTFRRITIDALYFMGIAKVGVIYPEMAFGYHVAEGEAFCDRIDLDDWVHDPGTSDLRRARFMGHRYRVPLAYAMQTGVFSKSGRDNLRATTKTTLNWEGDERITALQETFEEYGDEFEDMVDLWEIYVPDRGAIFTFSDDQMQGGDDSKPLRELPWIGPACGPYPDFLGFNWAPGQAVPKGTIPDLVDMHVAINGMYEKLVQQAEAQKDTLAYRGGSEADAKRFVGAGVNEAIKMDDPDGIKPMSWLGPNQQVQVFADFMRGMFKEQAGNMDAVGGLNPQAKTLGQDQMLQESSSRIVNAMARNVINHQSAVLKAMCWFWHHDSQKTMKAQYKVPGGGDADYVPVSATPQERAEVPYEEMRVEVDVYSQQPRTPATKLNFFMTSMDRLAPLMPLFMQQGKVPDADAITRIMAELGDCPELLDVFASAEPPMPESQQGQPEQPGMPANTKRTYERVSGSNNSSDNQHQSLVNDLMASAPGAQNGTINR